MSRVLIKVLKILARSNWWLTGVVMALLVIGVMFVYSACYVGEERGVLRPLYQRQILWIVVGVVSYFGMALYDYRRLRQISWAIYGVG